MKLTTTLNELKKHNPCLDGWETLVAYLGADYAPDTEINLLTILESNGVQDCLWTLRATLQNIKETAVRLTIEFASGVLHVFEEKYPDDKSPRQAIEAARAWLENPTEENKRKASAAAGAAAEAADAADADAADAAYSAAEAAAHAIYAAYSAANDAANAAAYCASAASAANAAVYAADAAVYAADAAAGAARAAVRGKQKEIIKNILADFTSAQNFKEKK